MGEHTGLEPLPKGFIYLCAVVDWASRKILSHRVSISMDSEFYIEVASDVAQKSSRPAFIGSFERVIAEVHPAIM